MKFQHILEKLYHRPWFISPGGYASIQQVVEDATTEDAAQLAAADLSDLFRSRDPLSIDSDGIATIHVLGALGRNLSPLEETCGNTSYETVSAELAQAAEAGAKGILFDIDSPGGMASGAGELAAEIAAASQFIPTATVVSDLCASAAYYLASSTGAIFAEPSATLGSVGVIIPWVDTEAAWALDGAFFDPITNEGADLKATMHGPSLSEAQRAYLQESVDDLASQFHAHVSECRDVDPEIFRAGAYVGDRAISLGLADYTGGMAEARAYLLTD